MIEDEAARSAAQGSERSREKLGLLRGRKAGPLRREDSRYWRGCRGGTAGTGGVRVKVRIRINAVVGR